MDSHLLGVPASLGHTRRSLESILLKEVHLAGLGTDTLRDVGTWIEYCVNSTNN